jgi:hypothetical protein
MTLDRAYQRVVGGRGSTQAALASPYDRKRSTARQAYQREEVAKAFLTAVASPYERVNRGEWQRRTGHVREGGGVRKRYWSGTRRPI